MGPREAGSAAESSGKAAPTRSRASPSARTDDSLAAGDVDGSIWLWDVPEGKPAGQSGRPRRRGQSIGLRPGRRRARLRGFDGSIRLWNVATKEQIGEPLAGHEAEVLERRLQLGRPHACLRRAPTERCDSGTSASTHLTASFRSPRARSSRHVAFAPDGRHARLGQRRRSRAAMGRTDSGAARRAPPSACRPEASKTSRSPPTARTLASAGSDGFLRLWDVARPPSARSTAGWLTSALSSASPSRPTGARSPPAATIRRCDCGKASSGSDLADLESQVCGLVVRNFTEAEWEELVPGLSYRTTCAT